MLKKELELENEQLKEELSGIKEMLSQLMKQKEEEKDSEKSIVSDSNVVAEKVEEVKYAKDLEPIEQNKYIRVTSLCNSVLNLSTEKYGKGKNITFNRFGQTRNVTYQMLEEIVNANRKLAENGRFFIQDEHAVRLLMLEEDYEKILDEKTITAIVDNKLANLLEVFKMTPKKQQDHVVSLIVKKVVNGGNADYNHLHAISDIYGKNLITMINDAMSNK